MRLRLLFLGACALSFACSDGGGAQPAEATGSSRAASSQGWQVPWPRLIAPLSTSTVTSRRPTLRWTLGNNVGTSHVDLCKDSLCTVPLTTATVGPSGTSAVPDADLPAGLVYWRVLFTAGGITGGTYTWSFHVGAASAQVDTSSGTTLDMNADGYADIVSAAPLAAVGFSPNGGRVFLELGSAHGIDQTDRQRAPFLNDPDGDYASFGSSVASAGDVNGDGFGDLIVSSPGVGSNTTGWDVGRVHVYFGSAYGFNPAKVTTLEGPAGPGALFGYAVSAAGDVNGDGFADVIVGAPGVKLGPRGANSGRAYVYLGGGGTVAGTPTALSVVLPIDDPDGPAAHFASTVASAGDVNGDGYGDIVVGSWGASTLTTKVAGRAHVYLGSAAGLQASAATDLDGPDGSHSDFATALAAADVDGDGYTDVVVGAQQANASAGRIHVYRGGTGGVLATPSVSIDGADGAYAYFGSSVAVAGDVNGDGIGDILVGSPESQNAPGSWSGRVHVLFGSRGTPLATGTVLDGPAGADTGFGNAVAGAGDVNGDGFADILVGASNATTSVGMGAGRIHLFWGSASGYVVSPTGETIIDGYDAWGSYGQSLALLGRRGRRPASPT